MRLAVAPNIVADEEILDVVLAGHTIDELTMLAETASRAVCRTLCLATKRAGVDADVLYNTRLDLKLRFTEPEGDADDFREEEE